MPAPDGEPTESSKENESNWVELKRDGLTFYYNYKYEVSLWEKPPSFLTSVCIRSFQEFSLTNFIVGSSKTNIRVREISFLYYQS